MTEPPTPPRQESAGKGETLPAPPAGSPGPEQIILNPQAEPSDDTPTIITRTPHRAGRPEDGFASTLRGRTLAHYELLEPVGVGGMAAVIRARDTQLDRIVALKILPPEMAADPETIRRFQHEARAAARLDHENIARVFFCGEDRGLNFISFEFVEGENLRTILDRRGRLPVPEAMHYILQVALGLAHAASRGVVHRDIKPSNIIITPTGRAKLVDMGLARHLEPQTDHALTQSGVTLGTFDYISPEQALEPRDADVRSDIYSLGCTFYHLVTGQAPVPEGTAARKLHHHQHVAPLDPRQLNPEIPDGVAAILARMMAKDLAERYQRPEQVIQHLVHVARQFGPAPEVPEEMLRADGPLPAPPRLRPLLMVGAAATILIALVVVETMTPPTLPPVASRPATISSQRPRESNRVPVERVAASQQDAHPAVSPRLSTDGPRSIRVSTARELADALTREPEAKRLEVLVANDIHLRAGDGGADLPGLLLHREKGHELILRSESPDFRPTIHWAYDAGKAARTWAALTVEGGKVTIEHLRFQIDAKEAAQIRMMAIRLQAGQLDVKNCAFVQLKPAASLARPYDVAASDGGWLASVAVEADTDQKPVLHCTGCCFLAQDRLSASDLARQASQVAARVSGPVDAVFDNCGFGPHATLFHLADKTDQTTLTLRHCSALLTTGAAFQIDDGSNCPLNLLHCLFAHAPAKSESSMDGQAILVRTTRRGRGNLYVGKDNRFYNLTAFCQQTAEDGPAIPITSWSDFKDRFARDSEADDSRVLDSSPWGNSDPLQELQNGLLAQAFRLDPQRAELRETGNKANRVIGVEECLQVRLYGSLPPLPERRAESHTIRTVNPSSNDSANGIYTTLNAAVLDAQPGDEIQIRSDGPMKVDPIALQRASCDLTIRPSRGFHPVLLLGEAPADAPAALFRLYDGKLRLIGLEFRLKPELRYLAPAIVTIAGSGQCTFRHCVVTLDPANAPDADSARLAVVVLADPRPAVKMDGSTVPATNPPAPPVVELDACFVRGTGDLVAMRSSRPVKLRGSNSLLALDGSLLTVRPYDNTKDMLPPGSMQLVLRNISAYLYDSLIRMRTNNDGKDLLPVAVTASECILTAATDGKAVVHFDGDMSDEKKMQDRVTWDGSNNVCSRFEKMFDQQVSDASPMMNLPPVGMKKWMDDNRDRSLWVYKDTDRVIGPRNDDDPLTILRPREFRVRKNDVPRACGADLGTVAQPATETRSDAGAPASKN